MRLVIASLVIIGALAHFASAQSCPTSTISCSTCSPSTTPNVWCSSSSYASSSTTGCCVSGYSGYNCPSGYLYYTNNCNTFSSNPNYYNSYVYVYCGGQCIAWIIISCLAWIANMCFVFRFCRQRNIEPCGYMAIAFFFGWWVWCCLWSAGRQQIVIVQTGQQYVPYQAQPVQLAQPGYNPAAYGQQAGYAPQAYPQAQPVNPYMQQPQNPYAQPANPYAQDGQISKPQ